MNRFEDQASFSTCQTRMISIQVLEVLVVLCESISPFGGLLGI